MLGHEFSVPLWVVLSCYAAMGLGTMLGGVRIVHTMGLEDHPADARAQRLLRRGRRRDHLCSSPPHFGVPVSTTHTITGAIVGVGASRRLSAVRWNVAGSIVFAWVATLPAAAIIAAATYGVASLF